MSPPLERTVDVNGAPCRIWEQGAGRPVFWLGSSPMLLRWNAFHDAAADRTRLVACWLPGYPGSAGHHQLDDHLSWCLAARDLLDAAGFKAGDTLMGTSTAGALAAEVAAIWPDRVGSLVLVASFGLFDASVPMRDMFALHPWDAAGAISADPKAYADQIAAPDNVNPVIWNIEVVRGNEAAARFLWPLGDTRLSKRLSRISARTRLIWGVEDRIIRRATPGFSPPRSAGRSPPSKSPTPDT